MSQDKKTVAETKLTEEEKLLEKKLLDSLSQLQRQI
jgi:intergrase/recombinase